MAALHALVGVLVLLTATAAQARALLGSGGVELSNSVILVSLHDITPGSGERQGQRQCEAVIERAKRFKSRSISMVVTAHWAGGRKGIDYFTLKDASGNQVTMNNDLLKQWEQGLTACFKAATDAGFNKIHILTHLDDPTGIWRNGLPFDPRKKYGGFSYEDVVLMPAARAMAAAAKPDTVVEFVLAGEMGRSMLGFPQNYINLMGPVKAAVNSGPQKPRQVLVGVSLNWSRHCGCTGSADLDPVKYNETYAKHFEADKGKLWSQYDVEGFKRLLQASEFIGLSGYGVLPPSNVQPADFQLPIITLAYELSFWGIKLQDLLGRGKTLVISEWGLGGSGRWARARARPPGAAATAGVCHTPRRPREHAQSLHASAAVRCCPTAASWAQCHAAPCRAAPSRAVPCRAMCCAVQVVRLHCAEQLRAGALPCARQVDELRLQQRPLAALRPARLQAPRVRRAAQLAAVLWRAQLQDQRHPPVVRGHVGRHGGAPHHRERTRRVRRQGHSGQDPHTQRQRERHALNAHRSASRRHTRQSSQPLRQPAGALSAGRLC